EQPDNYNLNYKLGYCYLQTKLEKHKAIKYLEKAVQGASDDYFPDDLLETRASLDAFFYLGQAYHFNYQFEQVIDTLNYLKTILYPVEKEYMEKIDRLIQCCINAKEIIKTSIPVILTHLGNGINSSYDDYCAVFPEDESFLIFTSKRKGSTGGLMLDDGSYYEDIYISYNKGGIWSMPVKIDRINSDFNEASVSLSPDGKLLFIYRAEGEDGNIFFSKIGQDGYWSILEKLPSPINTIARETHASITGDGNTLFFTSDRKGGYGGTDIYLIRKLPDGQWGLPQNIGLSVNTPYNEECPFINPEGNIIYFSSQGHKNMGGYDIFRSALLPNGQWSLAENVGYPINTTEDDLFFLPTTDGRRAYYSTHNTSGFGLSDIFQITLPVSGEEELAVISGVVSLSDDSVIKATITVKDFNSNKRLGIYTPNMITGKYLFILPPGKSYKAIYESEGYIPHTENIYIPKKSGYQEIEKTIELKHITLSNKPEEKTLHRDTVYIHDILFEFDREDASAGMLDTLVEFLRTNPDAIIEIGGHADSNGPEIYNIHLSLRRAIYIYNYLIAKGVNLQSLIIRGYGEKYPLITKEIPDGAEYDEMHKYNRRVEFKIIREGAQVLVIKPIQVPENLRN
ncbi:MAG: PD40 domain-containing protein, partial [Bacteroidia bacterium]|nr:PD40 domain-containing protein [Bacteroidia bacterium]